MRKLGWRASDTRELSFQDCAVPEDNLLGERGRGFHQFLEILDGGRISVAAMGVGLAQGAYDLAFAYAKRAAAVRPADRRVPGDPVPARRHGHRDRGRRGSSSTRPPGSRTRVAPSRSRRRWRSSTPGSSPTGSSTTPCRSTAATASWTSTPISRLYRDQKVLEIGEGTNEMQRMVIARHLGL